MIRPYTPSDKEACMLAFKTNVPKYFTLQEVSDFEWFLDKLADSTQEDNPPYFVLIENEKIIGCGGYGKKLGDTTSDNITFIWGLVHNDYHKQGYGKALFLFRLEKIKKHFPSNPIILDTSQHSYGFFEKLGFKTVKITENFYTKGMHRYDMLFADSNGSKS